MVCKKKLKNEDEKSFFIMEKKWKNWNVKSY